MVGSSVATPPVLAVLRLAAYANTRGSVSFIEHLRTLQKRGCALLGSTVLALQQVGIARWIRRPRGSESQRFRVAALLWDEVAQKMQGLIDGA